MALVVRELVIRATVEQGPGDKQAEPAQGAGGGAQAKQDIVAECVDQVLEILREGEER